MSKRVKIRVPVTLGDIIRSQQPTLAKRIPFDDRHLSPSVPKPANSLTETEKRRIWLQQQAMGERRGINEKDYLDFTKAPTGGEFAVLRWPLSKKVAWLCKNDPNSFKKFRCVIKPDGRTYSEIMSRFTLEQKINKILRELQDEILKELAKKARGKRISVKFLNVE